MKVRFTCLSMALLAVACGRSGEEVAVQLATTLPVLQPVSAPGLENINASMTSLGLAVSDRGHVAYTTRTDDGIVLVITDSTGSVLATRSGVLGPMAFLHFAPDDLLLALDVESRSWKAFRTNGSEVFSHPGHEVGIPYWMSRDSADVFDVESYATSGRVGFTEVSRVALNSPGSRRLVAGEDNVVQQLSVPQGTGVLNPIVATSADRIVLANPVTMRFQSLARDGTPLESWGVDLPPKLLTPEQVEEAVNRARAGTEDAARERASAPQRHFAVMEFDGRGRLWALNADLLSDTTVSYVFADSAFLGEVRIACRVSLIHLSISKDWLAIPCRDDSDATTDIRLFRITS